MKIANVELLSWVPTLADAFCSFLLSFLVYPYRSLVFFTCVVRDIRTRIMQIAKQLIEYQLRRKTIQKKCGGGKQKTELVTKVIDT